MLIIGNELMQKIICLVIIACDWIQNLISVIEVKIHKGKKNEHWRFLINETQPQLLLQYYLYSNYIGIVYSTFYKIYFHKINKKVNCFRIMSLKRQLMLNSCSRRMPNVAKFRIRFSFHIQNSILFLTHSLHASSCLCVV